MSWLGWSLEQWGTAGAVASGVGALATSVVAGVAARFAFHQVKEARELREDQAQPYVVAYFDISKASSMFIELIVKNIGQTLAKDIHIAFDPPLKSSLDDRKYAPSSAQFLKGIPTLPPAMEYRMLFDSGPDLYKHTDLPRKYRAMVEYQTSRGRHVALEYHLDLETFFDYESLTLYGEHDSAKALRDIANNVKKWTHNGGILVHARDEDERQNKLAELARVRRAGREKQASKDSGPDTDTKETKVASLDSQFETDI